MRISRAAYEQPEAQALRVNTGKFQKKPSFRWLPFSERVPWTRNGFIMERKTGLVGMCTTRRDFTICRSPAPWRWESWQEQDPGSGCWTCVRPPAARRPILPRT